MGVTFTAVLDASEAVTYKVKELFIVRSWDGR